MEAATTPRAVRRSQPAALAPRIGVALSGSGFRASCFHLGFLRRLESYGILGRAEAISAVSGGSLAAAYYLIEMQRKLQVNPFREREEAADEIIRQFISLASHDLAAAAGLYRPLQHPLRIFGLGTAGGDGALGAEIQRHFFRPSLTLGDLPRQEVTGGGDEIRFTGSRILLGTASLGTGQRRVFSQEPETGLDAQIAQRGINVLELGQIVGASCATPGQWRPVNMAGDRLLDGSLVDSLGLESLLDYFELSHPHDNRLRAEFRQPTLRPGPEHDIVVLVADGSGSLSAIRHSGRSQCVAALQAANRRRSMQMLQECQRSQLLSSYAFAHLTMQADDSLGVALPDEFVPALAALRDGFTPITPLEAELLVHHGSLLAKQALRKRVPELHPAITQPDPVPMPILAAQRRGDELKAARKKVEETRPKAVNPEGKESKSSRKRQKKLGEKRGGTKRSSEEREKGKKRTDAAAEDDPRLATAGEIVWRREEGDRVPYAVHLCNASICKASIVGESREWISKYLRDGARHWTRDIRRFPFLHGVLLALAISIVLTVSFGVMRLEIVRGRSLPTFVADFSCGVVNSLIPTAVPEVIEPHVEFLVSPSALRAGLAGPSGPNRSPGVIWSGMYVLTTLSVFAWALYLGMWLRWLALSRLPWAGYVEKYTLGGAPGDARVRKRRRNLKGVNVTPRSRRRRSEFMYYLWRTGRH